MEVTETEPHELKREKKRAEAREKVEEEINAHSEEEKGAQAQRLRSHCCVAPSSENMLRHQETHHQHECLLETAQPESAPFKEEDHEIQFEISDN